MECELLYNCSKVPRWIAHYIESNLYGYAIIEPILVLAFQKRHINPLILTSAMLINIMFYLYWDF